MRLLLRMPRGRDMGRRLLWRRLLRVADAGEGERGSGVVERGNIDPH